MNDDAHARSLEEREPRSERSTARKKHELALTARERSALLSLLSSPDTTRNHARRVRVVLLSADGLRGVEIAQRLRLSPGQVSRIRARFAERRVEGLADEKHPGRRDHAVSSEQVQAIERLSLSPPPEGRTRWSTRLIASRVGLTSATVAKVLRRTRAVDDGG
ncbi:MAG TPA: helix-turn-helix domain-containing protein [Polyangiaceae bacterium]|nr:helix-turn-helix domain-containing protein [Polyangiaceae bacterium]